MKTYRQRYNPVVRTLFVVGILIAALLGSALLQSESRAAAHLSVTNDSLVFTKGDTVQINATATEDVSWNVTNSLGEVIQSGNGTSGPFTITLGANLTQGLYHANFTSASSQDTVNFIILSDSPLSNDPFYRVQSHIGNTHNDAYDTRVTTPLMHQIGFGGIRSGIRWFSTERAPGVYEIPSVFSESIDTARSYDMDLLITASGGNTLYTPGVNNVDGTVAKEAYANFVAHYLSQNPDVTQLEVYNEFFLKPNETYGCRTGECYAELLKAVYDRVHDEYPHVQLIANLPSTEANSIEWITEVLDNGGIQYIDAISLHPYGFTVSGMEAQFNTINTLIRSYNNGNELPLLVSEYGWTDLNNRPQSMQSAHLASKFIFMRSVDNLTSASWYTGVNTGEDKTEREDNFGLFKGPSAYYPTQIATAHEPKEAAYAFYAMRSQLDTLEYISQNVINPQVTEYDFGTNEVPAVRTFVRTNLNLTELAATEFTIAVDPAKTTLVRDMYGNIIQQSTGTAALALSITNGPLYVTYLAQDDEDDDETEGNQPGSPGDNTSSENETKPTDGTASPSAPRAPNTGSGAQSTPSPSLVLSSLVLGALLLVFTGYAVRSHRATR